MSGEPTGPLCGRATRLKLLSKVGALAGVLEYDRVLSAVARLSIPELADWCIVDVVDDGEVRRVEVAHRDPTRAELAAELRAIPAEARFRAPSWEALLSGRSRLLTECTPEALDAPLAAIARRLAVRSLLAVPLVVGGKALAVATFLTTAESDRRYGPEDLALAEELAERAAQLVENARLHRQLAQSEARFRVALAHTHVSVFEKDPDLRYRWIYNPGFGMDPGDVLGRTDADFVPAEDAAHLEAIQRRVLATGEACRHEERITVGGEIHHLMSHLEALRDPAGAIVGLTGAIADITEQKRAQEELAEALAFRDQMMGILGHDLRNPLGAVRVLAALLLRRDDVPAGARGPLGEIDRAGKRMLEMIDTLLDFTESRFRGGLPVRPARTDLHPLARAVVDELLAANPGREIELRLDGDGHGTWDAARLAQVLSNLVANALTHGAPDAPVLVTMGGDAGALTLSVWNGGAPIPAELLPAIFEPFRGAARGNGARARGLGLGLYIADQIVQAHGGAIDVQSSAEQGTRFTVHLPRRLAARDPGHAAGQPLSA